MKVAVSRGGATVSVYLKASAKSETRARFPFVPSPAAAGEPPRAYPYYCLIVREKAGICDLHYVYYQRLALIL